MSRAALYNKYRPRTFRDVVEQDYIKQILTEELRTNSLKRVLLFTGGAGTGKTTSARIFANEVEENATNIIEINCADHTGVDDVRNLIINNAKSKPIVGNYKIFVLDECHMLTTQSQNALLKILEEPPSYCIFILCTTDPQKVLPTIMSRAFRYDFQLISHKGIVDRLQYILQQEQQENPDFVQGWEPEALNMIATLANGHMRNAIATLDKVLSYGNNVTVVNVENVSGTISYNTMFSLLAAIINKDQLKLLECLDIISKSGQDLKLFIKNFLNFVLDIEKYVLYKVDLRDLNVPINIPSSYKDTLGHFNGTHKDVLKRLLHILIDLNSNLRWETNPRAVIETNFLFEVI